MTEFSTIYPLQHSQKLKQTLCFKQFRQFFIYKIMCNSSYPYGYKYLKI